jgi:hypothetical protein
VLLSALSTGVIVLLSVLLVLPAFTQQAPKEVHKVLLSFELLDTDNTSQECLNLVSFLEKVQIHALVFVSGKLAEANEECISRLSNNSRIDIGSQTYSYSNLTSITDYTKALEEVRAGKAAVDRIGRIDSKLFKAPFGLTDENIYSLLTRSDILADFSYKQQYNKYENGQFVKYDLQTFDSIENSSSIHAAIESGSIPILVNLDSSVKASQVEIFISSLQSDDRIAIVNGSDLTGLELTKRTTSQ